MSYMEALSLLDTEELFLLVGGIFSLIFTCSFIIIFIRLFNGTLNFIDIPIISISLCYLNNFVLYIYSKLILHDFMELCYLISTFVSLSLIICYLIYEFKLDKFDVLLNFFILISITLSIHKLLIEVFNDEDKVKISCCFSTFALFCGIIEWVYKANQIKSKNVLNKFTGITLILMSGCYFLFGIYYSEFSFIFSNIFGIITGFLYLGFNYYLKNKYSNIQENRGNTEVDIENNGNEENEKDDINEQNELKSKRRKRTKH